MTRAQIDAVTAWRSSPLTSKTMWTIYVGQLSLGVLGWQYLALGGSQTSVMLALIAAIASVAITGVAGTSIAESVIKLLLARGPTVDADFVGHRPSTPPKAGP